LLLAGARVAVGRTQGLPHPRHRPVRFDARVPASLRTSARSSARS